MRFKVAYATDPGLEREENEDSVCVWKAKAGVDALLVVCDGMGGHAAGQTASSMAVSTVTGTLLEDGDKGPGLDRLRQACKAANTAVFQAARSNSAWAGMGSTLVVVAISDSEAGLLNVGDSPAYLFRNGEARMISQDHSWPAEQVRLGIIKPEDAINHPQKHKLARAVGVWESVHTFAEKLKIEEGDCIVLCSDGVETAGVSVEEMGELLFTNRDLEEGAKRVVARCRELGAPDNVTLAVVRAEPDLTTTAAMPVQR